MRPYVITFIKIGKTCKELSYEIKLQNDEITKTYRNAYKTQNAKKQRNKHIPDIENKFKNWVSNAQKQKQLCTDKVISLEDFKQWLKDNENWYLKKEGVKNGCTRNSKK